MLVEGQPRDQVAVRLRPALEDRGSRIVGADGGEDGVMQASSKHEPARRAVRSASE